VEAGQEGAVEGEAAYALLVCKHSKTEARTWGSPESCHPSPTATAPPVRHPDAHTQDHDGACTLYRFPPGDHDHHVAD
jgi:hypothetical protein